MPIEDKVYPLSDIDKNAIPFNVAKPSGAIIQDVTDAVSAAFVLSDITLPHILLANVDCLVGFNVIPDRTSITYQAGVLFVPEGKEVAVIPLHASLKVQALEAGATGKIVVQAFDKFESLGRDVLASEL